MFTLFGIFFLDTSETSQLEVKCLTGWGERRERKKRKKKSGASSSEGEKKKPVARLRLFRMIEKDAMVDSFFLSSKVSEEYENKERREEGWEKKENSGLKMEDG